MEARNPSSGTRQSLSCDGAGLLGSARVRLDRTEGWGQGASRESWCLLEEQKMKKENARLPGEATASLWSLHSLPAHHALCPLLGEEQPRILDVSEVTGTSTSPCPAPSFPPPPPPTRTPAGHQQGLGEQREGAKSSLRLRREKAWVLTGRDPQQWGSAEGPVWPAPDG